PATEADLTARYGQPLAQTVGAAPRDRWVQARSTFGSHVLRVDVEHPTAAPALAEIRPRVLSDWREAQREDARRRGVAALRERYRVQVQP
ncbi:MAG: hypothetical protein K0V04_32890, partial [Deltaproteobacteria bacterium]|nr:hypothetical protein [Deltaproteobacteria bacterium]